jgi:hypothetical protein
MQCTGLATLFLSLLALLNPAPSFAQSPSEPPGGYRFQPPRPPSVEDFYDDDEIELGDEGATGFRPPPPPTTPPPPPANNLPMEDGFARGTRDTKKLKFEVVDGIYYEKGKKRSRGKQFRVTPGDGAGGGAGAPPPNGF